MAGIHAFSKGVTTSKVDYQNITDPHNILKISEVLDKLLDFPNVVTVRMDDLEIDSYVYQWITKLLKDYPKKFTNKILVIYYRILQKDLRQE
jgi:hypothetical protein